MASFCFNHNTALPSNSAQPIVFLVMTYFQILLTGAAGDRCAPAIDPALGALRAQAGRKGETEAATMLDELAVFAALQRGEWAQARAWTRAPKMARRGAVPSMRCLIWVRCLLADGSSQALAQAQGVTAAVVEQSVLLRPAVILAAAHGATLYFLGLGPALTHLLMRLVNDPQVGPPAHTLLTAIASHDFCQTPVTKTKYIEKMYRTKQVAAVIHRFWELS